MSIIGVTGNIGSGKSLAAAYLQQFGAARIDADIIGHQLLRKGGAAYQPLLEHFGARILAADGEIDRRKLAAIVFAADGREQLQRLNDVTHPLIRRQIQAEIAAAQRDGYPHIVLEAALLLQAGWRRQVDQVWLIVAPEAELVRRVMLRDNVDEQTARARLERQLSERQMRALADRVFCNDGSPEQLREALYAAYSELEHKENKNG
ncbi:MAG: dephospho-CoA kinase [Bacillota bacterium]|nr:dephospho-CoA kinase [Bacillota bacterium]